MPSGHGLGPIEQFDALREAYFRYYDTPFRMRYEALNVERRELLDRAGGVWQPPILELRRPYMLDALPAVDSLLRCGSVDLSEFASAGVLSGIPQLYRHQLEAIRSSISGRDVVVTAGTGSGKTETFLLPIIHALVEESRTWSQSPGGQADWWRGDEDWRPSNSRSEAGRLRAVRAMILYPMNALVDDQLVRMRRALDSADAHDWLDKHRGGNRFHFGRYTGGTPVLGSPQNSLAVEQLRKLCRNWSAMREAAVTHDTVVHAQTGQDPQTRYQIPRLDGGEQVSRWDMLADSPDILVTNYSMLNVMLLRPRDADFFAGTRRWLELDPTHVFRFVVDELHMYRGTAGTEVAYLIRNLRDRLGLSDRPEQFQILAASASLDADRDSAYIHDFFGKTEGICFVDGQYQPTDEVSLPLANASEVCVSLNDAPTNQLRDRASKIFTEHAIDQAVSTAFAQTDSSLAMPWTELGKRIFGDDPIAELATRGLLRALPLLQGVSTTRLRVHYFFRNVAGMWACTSPHCSGISQDQTGLQGRPAIGRLLATPATRCPSCNARVLELLYCQDCGDVFLGGFSPEPPRAFADAAISLMADASELDRLPDQGRLDRNSDNYVIYWPSTNSIPAEDRQWQVGPYRFGWIPVQLDPLLGELSLAGDSQTGWRFAVDSMSRSASSVAISPFPTRCPSCSSDWELQALDRRPLRNDDPRRFRSPVRTMRTGLEKINQVLLSESMQSMPESQRSLVAFSDSRQDAAKLSAGITLRHFQDLIRTLFASQLMQDPVNSLLTDFLAEPTGTALAKIVTKWPELVTAAAAFLDDQANEAARATLVGAMQRPRALSEFEQPVVDALLDLGMNPGGPKPSVQRYKEVNWTDLLDSTALPPRWRTYPAYSVDESSLKQRIDASLKGEIYDSLTAGAGRDFESIGLAWFSDLDDGGEHSVDPRSDLALMRSTLRFLILMHRVEGLRSPATTPPAKLREYWSAVDQHFGSDDGTSRARMHVLCQKADSPILDWLVLPRRLAVQRGKLHWECESCRRRHMVFGTGLCTRCFKPLSKPAQVIDASSLDADFYAWRASKRFGLFRLNAAELTGQTGRIEAHDRQLRFQQVFLNGSLIAPLTDGLDLLSVTTTMEAGVDIGQLNSVAMSNMPPSRFNYQQRVGRAGRRTTPIATALTICRGRSHDDFYFADPLKITNSPTPAPYLALGQRQILERAALAEVLRRAIPVVASRLQIQVDSMDPHGSFGQTTDWPSLAPGVKDWLAMNATEVERIVSLFASQSQEVAEVANVRLPALLSRVSDVARSPFGSTSLSERLADFGLLPMFGFPTQVRYLYLAEPSKSYPWPPTKTIDRDASIAVTQFSPESEVIRDGSVYTAAGVVNYQPRAGAARPSVVSDPLGPRRVMDTCEVCSLLNDVDPSSTARVTCPSCGTPAPKYARVELRMPTGYFASARRDFDGNFEWTARGGVIRASAAFPSLKVKCHDGVRAHSGSGERFVINNNGGQFFAFAPTDANGVWKGALQAVPRAPSDPAIALAAIQHTDILFLEPLFRDLPQSGLDMNVGNRQQPFASVQDPNLGMKAVWHSVAFLARKAAAYRLDVQPTEFSAGVHVGQPQPELGNVRAFIADTLENGAGLATRLGGELLSELLESMRKISDEWLDGTHGENCSGSCYDCLRDFYNMPHHSLLDWRLSRDWLCAVRGEFRVDTDRVAESVNLFAHKVADARRLAHEEFVLLRSHDTLVGLLLRHPFESFSRDSIAPRLEGAAANAFEAGASTVVAVDLYTADRSPRAVLNVVAQAANVGSDGW